MLKHGHVLSVGNGARNRGSLGGVDQAVQFCTGRLVHQLLDERRPFISRDIRQAIPGFAGEEFAVVLLLKRPDVNRSVKPTRTQEGTVDKVDLVGRRHEVNVLVGAETVHQGQQLGNHRVGVCRGISAVSLATQRIKFVKKQNHWGGFLGSLEELPNGAFGFPHPLGEQFGTRNGHELNTGQAGNRLAEHRFPGSGRTVEDDTAVAVEPHGFEHVLVLNGCNEVLLELRLRCFVADDLVHVVETHVGGTTKFNLEGRGPIHRQFKVIIGNLQFGQLVFREFLGLHQSLDTVDPMHRQNGCMPAEVCQVGSSVAVGLLCPSVQAEVGLEGHGGGVDGENVLSAFDVRVGDVNASVKPTCSKQRIINRLHDVGRAHDQHLASLFKAVEFSEQLGENSLLQLTLVVLSRPCNGIDFVNEDDRGCFLLGLGEDISQLALRIPVRAHEQFRAVDVDEIALGFAGERLGQQGLANARRAVKQDAFRRVLAGLLVHFRMNERNDGDFLDLLDGVIEPSDVGEGNGGNVGASSSNRLVLCVNGRLINQPAVVRLHLGGAEFNRLAVDVDHETGTFADIDVTEAADSCVERFVIKIGNERLEADPLHGLGGQLSQTNGLALVHVGIEPHGGAHQNLTGISAFVHDNLCNGLRVADHHDGRSGSKAVWRAILKGNGDFVFSNVGVGLAG